jgi:hypothetical protein
VYDGKEYSDNATVTIKVNPGAVTAPSTPIANNRPQANDISYTTELGSSVTIDLAQNISDKDTGDLPLLTVSLTSLPHYGSVDANERVLVYTPNDPSSPSRPSNLAALSGSAGGVDSFKYRVYDGKEYSDNATVTIKVNPIISTGTGPATGGLDQWGCPAAFPFSTSTGLCADNSQPQPVSAGAPTGTAATGGLDQWGCPAAFPFSTSTGLCADNSQPQPVSAGAPTGTAATNQQQQLEASSTNVRPIAFDVGGESQPGQAVDVYLSTEDPGSNLAASIVDQPLCGSVIIDQIEGKLEYTPNSLSSLSGTKCPGSENAGWVDTFTYMVTDELGQGSNAAKVEIKINPTLQAISQSTNEVQQQAPPPGQMGTTPEVDLTGPASAGPGEPVTLTGELRGLQENQLVESKFSQLSGPNLAYSECFPSYSSSCLSPSITFNMPDCPAEQDSFTFKLTRTDNAGMTYNGTHTIELNCPDNDDNGNSDAGQEGGQQNNEEDDGFKTSTEENILTSSLVGSNVTN